jgi:hypothetical protein
LGPSTPGFFNKSEPKSSSEIQQAPVFPCCVPSVLFRGVRGVLNHVCKTLDAIYQQQKKQVTLRQTSKKAWSTPIFQISKPEISNDMHKIGAI